MRISFPPLENNLWCQLEILLITFSVVKDHLSCENKSVFWNHSLCDPTIQVKKEAIPTGIWTDRIFHITLRSTVGIITVSPAYPITSLKKLIFFLPSMKGKPKYFSYLDTTFNWKILLIAEICSFVVLPLKNMEDFSKLKICSQAFA